MKRTPRGCVFSYDFTDGILHITDFDEGGASVTNDIENVLYIISVERKHIDLSTKKIVYRDSEGIWDEVICERSGSNEHTYTNIQFLSLQKCTDLPTALERVK